MELFTPVKLFGKDYILVGDLDLGGPIATMEQYKKFQLSYAFLNPDGNIVRFSEVIGTRDDIKVLDGGEEDSET